MSVSLLIKKAAAEGVSIKLESDNKLKACGPAAARGKWLPIFREHKSELLAKLVHSDRQTVRPSDRHSVRVEEAGRLTPQRLSRHTTPLAFSAKPTGATLQPHGMG